MAKQEKRKGGGAKTSRTETVTVRLEPKLRYLAELAARKQRRTLSSLIEWAIQEGLDKVKIKEASHYTNALGENELAPEETVAKAASDLWDVDEEDRFIKLALHFPDLLTHEEQVLWKLIRENGYLWQGSFSGSGRKWTWSINQSDFISERLREYWPIFMAVARGEKERSALPKWKDCDSIAKTFDIDNIPF